MRVETNSKILFFGDSVTDAGRNRNTTNDIMVQKPFGDGYVDLVAGMFQGFYPQLNVHVKNAGISGNTTRDLLKRFDTDVADLKPDIIFIIGYARRFEVSPENTQGVDSDDHGRAVGDI